jgi:predicted Rossmann fold flavoprotein
LRYDAIIIGGGAAGLFCAITAGKRGRRVLVIEQNAEPGRKILISGGGRCNFTNKQVTADNFVSHNPHFARSALAGYTPDDFVSLVKRHRIPFYEKTLGQLFCRDSSRAIVDMLLAECRSAKVELMTSCEVRGVSRGEEFTVDTSLGRFTAGSLVIACGGLSFPKVGATGFGYRVAEQFGLAIEPLRPSLVAMITKKKADPKLAGVSAMADVATAGCRFRENILFTHRGLSGPAVLQVSNYWQPDRDVEIDLLPDVDAAAMLIEDRRSKKTVSNFLAERLPAKLAAAILPTAIGSKRIDQLSNADIAAVAEAVNNWNVRFTGTEGYDRAEVTLGGVSTNELDSKTMMAKRVNGLFFIGEVVDVTGWLGGYNFQWAWASGFAAGKAI